MEGNIMEEKYPIYNELLRNELNQGIVILVILGCMAVAVAIFCLVMKQPGLAFAAVGACAIILPSSNSNHGLQKENLC